MSDEQHPATTSDDLVGRLQNRLLINGDDPYPVSARCGDEILTRVVPQADITEAAARLSALERQVAGMREGLAEARSEITRAYRAAANGIPFTPENIPVIRKIAQALATQAESGDQP